MYKLISNVVDYLFNVLKSRTVWTIIALVVVNGVPSVKDLIPVQWLPALDLVLGLLATYFRVKPRQEF